MTSTLDALIPEAGEPGHDHRHSGLLRDTVGSILRQRRAERNRTGVAAIEAAEARQQPEANEERRKTIWKLPDPWRAEPAEAKKQWWKFW